MRLNDMTADASVCTLRYTAARLVYMLLVQVVSWRRGVAVRTSNCRSKGRVFDWTPGQR